MYTYKIQDTGLGIDFDKGCITSLICQERELLAQEKLPLFTIRLRRQDGSPLLLDAGMAAHCKVTQTDVVTACYTGFSPDLSVTVQLSHKEHFADWKISVKNHSDLLLEWVDFPNLLLAGPLLKNGGDAQILFPYNEGALVDDIEMRQASGFRYLEPEYPSQGSYGIFPNMISSQFMAYLFGKNGLYLGAHDENRSVKGIDFYPLNGGIKMQFRLFTGVNYGEDFATDYPLVWDFFTGDWYDGAELYRSWLSAHLPAGLCRAGENPLLPDWYENAPLAIIYPVRGIHDMDEMNPNAFFPYINALPALDEIAEKTGCQLMAILMHWEGTAPWAPPYVWPPYGGEAALNEFIDKLHEKGHLLGVYCSGIGWTLKSNLVDHYETKERFEQEDLQRAMCKAPDGSLPYSMICTGQRVGYDLCPGSKLAQKILQEAYGPLLASRVDYIQIMDQNHGGNSYFCYSKEHGHPPVPGLWQVQAMQTLLTNWQKQAGKTLLGCESAAAEPFLPNLLFSDNRFELNYWIGMPVPLHAYLYHEYMHNFMGNQVGCGFDPVKDSMCYRMAYSFASGDCMALVLSPDNELMANWGRHDFTYRPDKEAALSFAANMNRFYRTEGKKYLFDGKMIKPAAYETQTVSFPFPGRDITVPAILTSAWEATDGSRAQIFINHTDEEANCTCTRNGQTIHFTVPAKQAVLQRL